MRMGLAEQLVADRLPGLGRLPQHASQSQREQLLDHRPELLQAIIHRVETVFRQA